MLGTSLQLFILLLSLLNQHTLAETSFTLDETWRIVHSGSVQNIDADVIVVDMFDTKKETITDLKSKGKKVICYVSVGTFENWRSDTNKFTDDILGKTLGEWPDEKWLDIRSPFALSIMQERFTLAKEKGCDAIDADNMDGFMNETGFNLTGSDQLQYNLQIAYAARSIGLAIGLKNDGTQAAILEPSFDFAIVESCTSESCMPFKQFLQKDKPVIQLEYGIENAAKICAEKDIFGFQTIVKDRVISDTEFRCKK